MKVHVSILAVSMALGIALAQDTPPQATPQATPPKTEAKPQSDMKDSPKAEISSPAEMKTTTFKGTLIDVSCASRPAAGPSAAAPPSSSDNNSANRSAGDANCPVSANSTNLGMTLKDGRTVRFDLVGNQRAQDALKTDKGWNKTLTAGKPIHATVSGVLNGDKLIVSSIH